MRHRFEGEPASEALLKEIKKSYFDKKDAIQEVDESIFDCLEEFKKELPKN